VFKNVAGEATSGSARLEVLTVPEVTSNPADVVANAGSPASFTAEATGRPAPAVQWQVSKDGGATWSSDGDASAQSTTLTIPAVTPSQNGNRYRAMFTNAAGSRSSLPAKLEVRSPPTITANPSSKVVNEGQSASFTAAAAGFPAPTVQWQVSTDAGETWENDVADAGATSTTLTITSATLEQSGNEYRAVFTNLLGSVTSAAATLTVHEPRIAPVVTSNPSDRSVIAGEAAVFSAAASGRPAPSVQWEVSTNGGVTWAADGTDSGTKTTTMVVTSTTLAQSGSKYRAVFSNGVSPAATTAAATLTVSPRPEAPHVTKQPSDVEKAAGETATFTAAATGVPSPSVQWQVHQSGGSWVNDTADAGNTSGTLTVAGVTAAQNGSQYRAVFSNASGAVETAPAKLTVLTPPKITLDPVNTAVIEGEEASFTAAATGVPTPHVQWEYSKNGGASWSNGPTSSEFVIPSPGLSLNGLKVRATFSNTVLGVVKTATTTVATLTVAAGPEAPHVTAQPAKVVKVVGETATFTAAAGGVPTPSVQWQVLVPGGSWVNDTTDPGNTSGTLTVSGLTAAQNGNEYRAVFSNPSGTAETVPALLTVQAPPTITSDPADATVNAGDTASFSAAANGNPAPEVRWQLSADGGATWADIPGATAGTLDVPGVTAADSGHMFRAVFKNVIGEAATRGAMLSVSVPPPPLPPSASFTWFPPAPRVGEVVTLASTSTDSSSPITGYAWDAQGTNIFTPGPSVITTLFTKTGVHTVHLRVTDGNGQTSVATEGVAVSPVKLGLLQPFPIVRIAGTDSRFGARISLLTVQAPVGAHVLVSCSGRGCPRAHEARTATSGRTKRSVVLLTFTRFERRLRAGVKLEIKVYARGSIGKYTSFRIRRSQLPARVDACLDPQTLRAMSCPTS
jgi:hypothetical protein